MRTHLRVSCHNLLLCRQRWVLLEFKVANSTTQRKITIHTVKFNKTASIQDTRVLFSISWLVIVTHRLCLASQTKHTSRVTGVGNINTTSLFIGIRHNQSCHSRASRCVIRIDGITSQIFIRLEESTVQCCLPLLFLELGQIKQTRMQCATRVARDICACFVSCGYTYRHDHRKQQRNSHAPRGW